MAQIYRKSRIDNIYLSKSLFIRGLQCHKSLYLQKFKPELKDAVSEEAQKRFDIGNDAGSLAQQLFPGGVIVPYAGLSHSEQLSMTQTLIGQGLDTIYEAAFSHNGVFVKADILHRGNSGWEIYEVKSSSSVKDYHFDDASVQYHVISGTGLPVTKVFIVHINTGYVRHGEIEVHKLFKIVDITETAKGKESLIAEELQKQQTMLKGDEPVIDNTPNAMIHLNAPSRAIVGHPSPPHPYLIIKYNSTIDFSDQSIDNGSKGGILEGEAGLRLPS